MEKKVVHDKRKVPAPVVANEVKQPVGAPRGIAILGALQPGSTLSKHVYAGTVDRQEAQRRLDKFKAQKKARRINRGKK